MRILCLNESLIMGGQEKVFIEYLKLLEKTDYDIDILIEEDNNERNTFISEIPTKYSKKIKFLCDSKIMDKLEKSRIKRKSSLIEKIKYSFLLKRQSKEAKKKLYKFLEENKYDLILDFSNILGSDMAIGKNIRWVHSSVSEMSEKKLKKFKEKVRNSKATIVIAKEMKLEIVEKIGLEKKLVTIYNPFDIDRIKELSNERNSLTLEENKLIEEDYIVAVSRLDDVHKNITGLIKSYKLALENGIKEKLYIIGNGNDREKLLELVEELGLKEKVFLLGMKRNPYVWIKNSNIFVLNSNWEGLPTVLIESLILEKMIISTNCPTGPKEILEGGKSGILVKVGDSIELSKKISETSKNKNYKEIYQSNGAKSVERFSRDTVLKKLLEVIEGRK